MKSKTFKPIYEVRGAFNNEEIESLKKRLVEQLGDEYHVIVYSVPEMCRHQLDTKILQPKKSLWNYIFK